MKLIDGLKIAEQQKKELAEKITSAAGSGTPKLAIIYAGQNEASQIYVDKKIAWAKEVGISAEMIRLPETDTEELIDIIKKLNTDNTVSGIIVQLPLPKNTDRKKILEAITPEKDVDGLSPISLGRLFHAQKEMLVSATALAVMDCLQYSGIEDFEGKNVLIINHSILVGKPLIAIMLNAKATVSIAHEHTPQEQLYKIIGENDIIISATGQSGLIKKEHLHNGQIVIDVGINKSAVGVGGDIDPTEMEDLDIWLSPVPNGVGPVTVIKLLENTYKAFLNLKK